MEGQLKLTSLDNYVGEVEQMHFERIQHAFPGYDNLSGLFLNGQSPDESRDFFGGFPLGQLSEAFLARPSTGVYDFEVKLAVSRVEDKYGAVDRFSRQVALEGLVRDQVLRHALGPAGFRGFAKSQRLGLALEGHQLHIGGVVGHAVPFRMEPWIG